MKEVYAPFIPGSYNENNLDELSVLLEKEKSTLSIIFYGVIPGIFHQLIFQ
ncbi:hypothetical protein ACFJIV_17555 [Mucilaginibacter sp. UC70_90]